ncbi:ead/Ea22-like family protein [Escherichia coli]
MSNIDKRALREAAEKATPGPWRRASTQFNGITHGKFSFTKEDIIASAPEKRDAIFIAAANPATVLALLDELEAAEKRIAEPSGQKRLIGWRASDYTDETSDPELAKNWAAAIGVLPIFEGDVNTKLSVAGIGKGE